VSPAQWPNLTFRAPQDLVATATGSVWMADQPDPRALAHWRTGNGRYRHVGREHVGAELLSPSLEDAYLLMRDTTHKAEVTT